MFPWYGNLESIPQNHAGFPFRCRKITLLRIIIKLERVRQSTVVDIEMEENLPIFAYIFQNFVVKRKFYFFSRIETLFVDGIAKNFDTFVT